MTAFSYNTCDDGSGSLSCEQSPSALAREVGADNVTVNCIAPGAFPTAAEEIYPDPEGYTRYVLENQCLKRRGRPEDIGNAVLFLASDAASFITGQTIAVDGGWAMP
jgi:NAD(P)-dependent dehydrogenase (short-subunit alcohol dehydrogenase family)